MIVFECNVCRTALSAEEAQAGQLVRCPKCLTTLRVPVAERAAVGAGVGGGVSSGAYMPPPPRSGYERGGMTGMLGGTGRAAGRRFGFNCGYCSSRLEANESQSGQEGQNAKVNRFHESMPRPLNWAGA